jgi:hypothetical protein
MGSLRFKVSRDPLSVDFERAGSRRAVRFQPFARPDALYRLAARTVIGRLLSENRRLRRELDAANRRAQMTVRIDRGS